MEATYICCHLQNYPETRDVVSSIIGLHFVEDNLFSHERFKSCA